MYIILLTLGCKDDIPYRFNNRPATCRNCSHLLQLPSASCETELRDRQLLAELNGNCNANRISEKIKDFCKMACGNCNSK